MIDRLDEFVREARRIALGASTKKIGLDWIDVKVESVTPTSATLILHFVPTAAPSTLLESIRAQHIVITAKHVDGPPALVAESVTRSPDLDHALLVYLRLPAMQEHGQVWNARIINVAAIDPFFDQSSFRLGRGPDVAGGTGPGDPEEAPAEPILDYTARDFDGILQVMRDRLAIADPSYTEQHPADMGVAIMEVLAYAADRMSYYQDAVATEAYLPRARKRISIRRHTRLLDYRLSEGVNGRTWVRFEVTAETKLPKGTMILAGAPGDGAVLDPANSMQSRILEQSMIFETMHETTLQSDCNRFVLYDWGASEFRLPKRSTSAYLKEKPPKGLHAGDILLFEAHSPTSDVNDPAAQIQCYPVRLTSDPIPARDDLLEQDLTKIEWSPNDALPVELVVTTAGAEGQPIRNLTCVYGNLVLADHGQTVTDTITCIGGAAVLPHSNLTFAEPLPTQDTSLSSLALLVQSLALAVPCVQLEEKTPYPHPEALAKNAFVETRQWFAQPDLMSSSPFARHFVVEMDDQRRAHLRFGDGQAGLRPKDATKMVATYRIGNGTIGNVARDTLKRVVGKFKTITRLTNPLPAASGLEYESIETARRRAPALMYQDARCVTPEDYVARACQHPDVARAAAEICWTGSTSVVVVHVERTAGRPENATFCSDVQQFLLSFSIAGMAIAVFPALRIPLILEMQLQLARGANAIRVCKQVLAALGARLGFEPQTATIPRLGFGEPVWPSDLVARAMDIAGVASATVRNLCRVSENHSVGINSLGVVEIAPNELAWIANSPHAPTRGTVQLTIGERAI